MNQFPQPTRPIDSYNLMPVLQMPQASSMPVNKGSDLYATEERYQFQTYDTSIPQSTATVTEEEKQAIEDLLRVISEWYEKLPESIKGTINLEELNATTLRVNGGVKEIVHNFERLKEKTTGNFNSSRGLDDGPEAELREGLERFKIRTVDLGGVVKEEEKR